MIFQIWPTFLGQNYQNKFTHVVITTSRFQLSNNWKNYFCASNGSWITSKNATPFLSRFCSPKKTKNPKFYQFFDKTPKCSEAMLHFLEAPFSSFFTGVKMRVLTQFVPEKWAKSRNIALFVSILPELFHSHCSNWIDISILQLCVC